MNQVIAHKPAPVPESEVWPKVQSVVESDGGIRGLNRWFRPFIPDVNLAACKLSLACHVLR
jgi:hypothetical protein